MVIYIAFAVIAIDQITKFLVLNSANLPREIIKGVFSITPTQNTGGAFSILQNYGSIFIIISSAAVILLIVMIRDMKKNKEDSKRNKAIMISLSMILGGAIGNLMDRVRLGHVVDFLDFKIWPVFNVADSAITVGVVILLVRMILSGRKNNKS